MAEAKFILADIGGYTTFLSDVGLKHAREITEDLLNRLVDRVKGRWKVANIMGDCVFFYAARDEAGTATFAHIRSLYEEFREGVMDIANGSACACGACNRTEDLTLKFVASAGEYELQNIGGRKELIGGDIVRASRLLKNTVPVSEYALLTPEVSDVAATCGIDATLGHDDYDDIGRVDYTYLDLQTVRTAYEEARTFFIARADAKMAFEIEIDAPADAVWTAMRDLNKRAVWAVTLDKATHLQGPENGLGEIYSCLHGGHKVMHMTIAMDHEGRRKTERMWISPPFMRDIYTTARVTPISEGQARAGLYATFEPAIPVVSRLIAPVFYRIMKRNLRNDLAGLKEYCETGSVASRQTQAAKPSA
ncbi:MAG: DUF2652 domain-containing protein [Dehalococcoidia bacterium]